MQHFPATSGTYNRTAFCIQAIQCNINEEHITDLYPVQMWERETYCYIISGCQSQNNTFSVSARDVQN